MLRPIGAIYHKKIIGAISIATRGPKGVVRVFPVGTGRRRVAPRVSWPVGARALRLPGERRRCYIPPVGFLWEGDGVRTIDWADGRIRIIDQTRLPAEEAIISLESVEEVAEAISSLRVRGAPPPGA